MKTFLLYFSCFLCCVSLFYLCFFFLVWFGLVRLVFYDHNYICVILFIYFYLDYLFYLFYFFINFLLFFYYFYLCVLLTYSVPCHTQAAFLQTCFHNLPNNLLPSLSHSSTVLLYCPPLLSPLPSTLLLYSPSPPFLISSSPPLLPPLCLADPLCNIRLVTKAIHQFC
jgi:hypothetical protein